GSVHKFQRLIEEGKFFILDSLGGADREAVAIRVGEERSHRLVHDRRAIKKISGPRRQVGTEDLLRAESKLVRIPKVEDKALFGGSADVFVGCLRLAKVQRNVAEARKILQPE